ncbi:hypothetical protein T05_3361 [Trichinella murrelli]|uniref:Uncharacterized protein n=1 Tax=Trichinella murrelli TaxID=144512 RepID=A0A0V0U5X3_9BILA|nr:hypothetical protein T05_3361 [Trichinella murrelli]
MNSIYTTIKFYNLRKSVLRNVALSVIFVLMMMTFLHAFRLNLHMMLYNFKNKHVRFLFVNFPSSFTGQRFLLIPECLPRVVFYYRLSDVSFMLHSCYVFKRKYSLLSWFDDVLLNAVLCFIHYMFKYLTPWLMENITCHNYASYRNDQPGVVEGDEVYLKCKLVLCQI